MTTRYQESQIEDVARVIASFVRIQMVVPGGATGPEMAAAFADLFAADNPRTCPDCGDEEGTASICAHSCGAHHIFTGGFDRERFLAACGLESEG